MKHYGDITKISGRDVPAVDIICGGSPCQDLSVAGKREGLSGKRSGLFMEQLRIIKEMREKDAAEQLSMSKPNEYIRPRFMVWENVPGAFSSNKGEDFRIVLEETAKVVERDACIPGPPNKGKWPSAGCIMGNGWSIAWRVHDAQFWGVPQRRKRIALVADFGGGAAPEILFECKGMSGDFEESGKEGQGAATDAERSIGETISFQERAGKPGGGKGILIQNERTGALSTVNNQSVCAFEPGAASRLGGYCWEDKAGTLRANAGDNQQAVCLNSWDVQSKHIQPENGIAESLYAGECRGGGGESYVFCIQGNCIDRADTAGCNGKGVRENQSYTLNTIDRHAVAYKKQGDSQNTKQECSSIENHPNDSRVKIREDGKVQTLSSRMGTGGGNVPMIDEKDKAFSLRNRDYKDPQTVCYGLDRAAFNQGINAQYDFRVEKEKIGTQVAKGPGAVCQSVVRRLTPLECERLQGYPDGWTDIGEWYDSKGKKHKNADSPRYKALGNSIALPFWEWMAKRMVRLIKNDESEKKPTMASLFDGIGGFPLVYSRCGCVPVWASEIEEFPIAVTKIRFPEGSECEWKR